MHTRTWAGHTPQAEADHFARTVGRLQKGEILALDMEEPFGDPGDWSLAFLQTLESIYHFKPYIYTYRYYLQTHDFSMVKAAGFPLWIAAYQDTKPITSWYAPLWQNTDQGRLVVTETYLSGLARFSLTDMQSSHHISSLRRPASEIFR